MGNVVRAGGKRLRTSKSNMKENMTQTHQESAARTYETAADERAIREVIATWFEATKAGDTAKVLSLMSDDVVFLVAGKRPFGKQEFAAAQQEQKGVRFDATSQVREIHVTGDWAYCWTDLSVVATPEKGGSPVKRSGNTMSIFRRQPDGTWLLARDANLLAPDPKT